MRRRSRGRRRSVDRGTRGQGIEPRNQTLRGADAVKRGGRQHGPSGANASRSDGPARSETPRTCGNSLRENREIPGSPVGGWSGGTRREGRGPYAGDARPGKSDRPVVPTKPPNKAGRPAAEVVEGRGLAKGNADEQNAPRTQSRTRRAQCARPCTSSSSKGQGGTVHRAPAPRRRRPTPRRRSSRLKKKAAPGVDGVTWEQYGGAARGQPPGPARAAAPGSVPGEAVAKGVHPEGGRAAATARASRRWRTRSSSGRRRGAQRHLRGGLSRLLLRIPAGAQPASMRWTRSRSGSCGRR